MSRKFRLNKPKRKPAHWSKERYDKYLEDYEIDKANREVDKALNKLRSVRF